ncbi:MAG: hypothetical protein Q8R16_04535 [bacterium]|nr:hypothetical protein [bacterium]
MTPRESSEPPVREAPPRGRLVLALSPILVLVMVVAGYAVLLRPKFAALRDLRQRAAIEPEAAELESLATQLARTRATFEQELAGKRELIDAAIPDREQVPTLFVMLDAAAQNSGVSITTMEVTREPAPATLTTIAGKPMLLVNLAVRGVDYPRLKAFIGNLSASRRLMDVLSVQFSPSGLSATLRIRTYALES